ncbi:hypothetical protein Tco_0655091 [Tanacetum coccineum]|uniref:Uncharacterized protein n=1 Tax=Tanacetum coccineum TaxID=301880 RepID=A0ABQ4X5C4_9ASTR
MFTEADFLRLNQNDIKELYLLKIQDKIHNLDGVDEFDLINALLLYIRRIVIKKGVEDAHMGERDQTKLNLTKPYDGMLNKVYRKVDVMLVDNVLGYGNKGLKDHEWTKKDKVDDGQDWEDIKGETKDGKA